MQGIRIALVVVTFATVASVALGIPTHGAHSKNLRFRGFDSQLSKAWDQKKLNGCKMTDTVIYEEKTGTSAENKPWQVKDLSSFLDNKYTFTYCLNGGALQHQFVLVKTLKVEKNGKLEESLDNFRIEIMAEKAEGPANTCEDQSVGAQLVIKFRKVPDWYACRDLNGDVKRQSEKHDLRGLIKYVKGKMTKYGTYGFASNNCQKVAGKIMKFLEKYIDDPQDD